VLGAATQRAIVVGSSMGGIVATQGAARCPERVAALVYAAAFIPKDGQSLLDLTKLPEGAGDQVQANIAVSGEPPVAVMSVAASRDALYACCADDVAEAAIAQQQPQPVIPFATPVEIPSGALDRIAKYCVVCTRDRAIPPPLQRRMSSENACADVVEIETDHTPQLSRPDDLARALDRFAAHLERARP
jgi:pimeloyl-ACP methyl ester carboxylesterase